MAESRTFRSHEEGLVALVAGASGGIGAALARELLRSYSVRDLWLVSRREPDADLIADPRVAWRQGDLLDEEFLGALREELTRAAGSLDLVLNACGLLHAEGVAPEKRLAAVRKSNLERLFAINAVLPVLLAQATAPLMKRSRDAVFASLSARVGSISDNASGGWHAYRASKAAHNMLLRNVALEWRVTQPLTTVVMLQPGTVRTALSQPFLQGAAAAKALEPSDSAAHLLRVLEGVSPATSGAFLDWRGESIPF
jgi:NAD(P)-dependent dehydrogenase (short-subunit alcohol dehydrogenase family)